MAELDPHLTREDRRNRAMAAATAVGIVALTLTSFHGRLEASVARDFYDQYLADGKCLTNSYYPGGKITVSGVGVPGETTVAVRPNDAMIAKPIDLTRATMTFVEENGEFKPSNAMAMSTTSIYDCPEASS